MQNFLRTEDLSPLNRGGVAVAGKSENNLSLPETT
jgi:hypothetical protein